MRDVSKRVSRLMTSERAWRGSSELSELRVVVREICVLLVWVWRLRALREQGEQEVVAWRRKEPSLSKEPRTGEAYEIGYRSCTSRLSKQISDHNRGRVSARARRRAR